MSRPFTTMSSPALVFWTKAISDGFAPIMRANCGLTARIASPAYSPRPSPPPYMWKSMYFCIPSRVWVLSGQCDAVSRYGCRSTRGYRSRIEAMSESVGEAPPWLSHAAWTAAAAAPAAPRN